ncbi:response regulator transcription factor [Terricaulis sp.]|uniref:response regulator transcription factor n=1 Tax=Terricaulis sp. TaxID=2768686 RepID=UPI002AC6165C|nr:response regulator [Terricaulis sp.]MDZ4690836.1 response regulator [Terricaulis sp.]
MVLATVDQICRPIPVPVLVLVDDDPAVRHALSFAFETAGIRVVTFADAEAALSVRDRTAWSCLVLDQKLPGISGLDLLERLRAAGVEAPTILITTHPTRITRQRALAAGVEIVEKPLLDNQLSQKVREIMIGAPG